MPATGEADQRSALRRLDDAVVPHLQRRAQAVAGALGAPLRGLHRWEERFAGGAPARALWRRRQVLLLVAALIVCSASYVHLQRYPRLTAQADTSPLAPGDGDGAGQVGGEPPGGSVAVGPAEGADLGSYLEQRRRALAEAPADEQRLAVVSFGDYLTPEAAAEAVGGDAEPLLAQLRVPDDRAEPFQVTAEGGVAAAAERALAEERERVASEEAEFRELIESGTVEDQGFLADFREQLDRLRAVRNLLDSGTGTVFAVVVRGTVADLRALAERDPVRLVDLAPADADPERSRFHGVLPDDASTASFGTRG